ncbi:aminopeptidase [Brevibacillus choshinensis]|uniref:Aminopeptidase n=1 Tax=Brevibacillus choshinensis TaxID=54911 RepID=A0ABX7FRZ0_BRECH|nr:aminopeptidase [Brevibacillus choshinensis]QRG68942.1 aminopeptidase [Brevibacillus choshinensis]
MNLFEQHLHKYAELVIKVGVNLQPGQVLYLGAPLECAEFVRIIVRKAYEAGAVYVQVAWEDDSVTRARFEYARDDSFHYYPQWIASSMEQLAESGGALLAIDVPNPDLYAGIDNAKVSAARRAAATARQKYLGYVRTNRLSWCLINAPTEAWADKAFPELPQTERIPALWEAVFLMTRVDQEDPIAAWHAHIQHLRSLCGKLNAKQYKKLHYKGPGTDLTIELVDNHVWTGGSSHSQAGVEFIANVPTEEVFTMPRRQGTNGVVFGTMPFVLGGTVVDRFSLTFRDGEVIDFTAEVGYEALKSFLETDDGARYLGEVALVSHDSPISNMKRIFYNTGIDENASCHFALGSSYPFTLKGGTQLSKEELQELGANDSVVHEDFMIGSDQLDIDGELADGTIEPLFRKGNWAWK